MEILDPQQLAILRRVRSGRYLGDEPPDELRDNVALMLELRIIEPTGACPYRLTSAGERILALAEQVRLRAHRR